VDTLLFASGNALVQFSPMLIIPVLAPLMTQLLGASQGLLPWLFFGGGLAGYLSTRMTGALTSRVSALSLATGSTLVFILSLLIPVMGYPHPALFITLFLGAAYSRLVSSSAVTIQFPDNKQRAGFSSLQTSMMYLMTTAAFFLSAFLLPDHRMALQNMDTLLAVCAITASGTPIIVIVLQKKLAKRTFEPDRFTTE
ncbi:MFS transporter, partial [Klebsiella pneumoniae]|nr:MFS transporter [Klebsiella pneumoniae]